MHIYIQHSFLFIFNSTNTIFYKKKKRKHFNNKCAHKYIRYFFFVFQHIIKNIYNIQIAHCIFYYLVIYIYMYIFSLSNFSIFYIIIIVNFSIYIYIYRFISIIFAFLKFEQNKNLFIYIYIYIYKIMNLLQFFSSYFIYLCAYYFMKKMKKKIFVL